MTATMFPDCVIPGCANPVARVGEPCGACVTAFGPMLREIPGNGRSDDEIAAAIAERDRGVRAAYALQVVPPVEVVPRAMTERRRYADRVRISQLFQETP